MSFLYLIKTSRTDIWLRSNVPKIDIFQIIAGRKEAGSNKLFDVMVGGSCAAACKNNTNIVMCKAKNDQNIHFMRIFVHFTRNLKKMVQIFLGFESNANAMLALS